MVFVCVVATNYIADPGNLTQNELFFDRMLALMQDGYNIEFVSDFKDRLFQEHAAKVIDRPQTLIFGSSRIQQIDSTICGDHMWNAGVSSATTQDICALYQVFSEQGKVGDRVIIGIDLWTFDGTHSDPRCETFLSEPLARFTEQKLGKKTKVTPYSSLTSLKELTTLSYFQSSVQYLTNPNRGNRMRDLITSTELSSDFGMLRHDGSYAYPNSYMYPSQKEMETRVALAREAVVAPILVWGGIDPELREMFTALCDDIVSNGSELVLLISPIHPFSYLEIQQNGAEHSLKEVEDYLHTYADSIGATVIGSFDPVACKCDYSDFMDALHITYNTTERLWAPQLKNK